MKRQRSPYAGRSVWYVVAVLSVVLVAGFVVGGYEIIHLRTQVNNLNATVYPLRAQVNKLGTSVTDLYNTILKLAQLLPQH
jgi:outer membrane murein-binding lipoprotein Lpp